MYARGMTMGEIRGHLIALYGLEVSPELIPSLTPLGLHCFHQISG
jgi:hypothetical protein